MGKRVLLNYVTLIQEPQSHSSMVNHGMLALNNIEVGGHVPQAAQSGSELPCTDDIAADVNNECDLFVQASSPRWEWHMELTTCEPEKAQGAKRGADLRRMVKATSPHR